MSDRALRVLAGLCAGLAALALALAALSGMVVGVLQDGFAAAYGAASITQGAGGQLAISTLRVVVFSVLAAIVALAGMAVCIVLLRQRRGRNNP